MKLIYFILLFVAVTFCYLRPDNHFNVDGPFFLKDGTHFGHLILNLNKDSYLPIYTGRIGSIVNSKEKKIKESIEITYRNIDKNIDSGIISLKSYITENVTYIVNNTLEIVNGRMNHKSYCSRIEGYKYDNSRGKIVNYVNDEIYYAVDSQILYTTHFSMAGLPQRLWPRYGCSIWHQINSLYPISVRMEISQDRESYNMLQRVYLYDYIEIPVYNEGSTHRSNILDRSPLMDKIYNEYDDSQNMDLTCFSDCEFYQELLSV
ncbi:Hypothetical protein ORPV_167 [Orpheovirus IHUMI-LCC2]|uniref:Uncharacterized protein n=1 Tax=Orpheovirus IHUMI-LCC2 TaxID=2023057 RepID=A0A2I2L3H3_9VIRU|nr:Hypothetical protein ORPV_167 [Orpheovirus IHUMI-LCC2]SNW62071.1 Hypothetical protein ORPV_167 [Orpheovirus IHUMI-LCC2]